MTRFSNSQKGDLVNILSRERIDYWKQFVNQPNMTEWRARVKCSVAPSDEDVARLHEWNAVLASTMMASLQIFELSIRNHINAALTDHLHSPEWWGIKTGNTWTVSSHVNGGQINDVQNAIRVSGRRPKGVTSGGVISELSFGFWLALLTQAYDNPSGKNTLWRDCLHKVFEKSGKISRKDAYAQLASIVSLRNKCAHHEPVLNLDINREFILLLSFTRRFSASTAEWISSTSLVPYILKSDWLGGLGVCGRLIGLP